MFFVFLNLSLCLVLGLFLCFLWSSCFNSVFNFFYLVKIYKLFLKKLDADMIFYIIFLFAPAVSSAFSAS